MEFSPLTVLPDTLLVDVIALMNPVSRSKVDSASDFSSCVLVVEGKKIVGIFTQRDVVRLTSTGVDLSEVKISQVMTQPVISLTRTAAQNALTALAFMRQHHIRHLPVVDELGELQGLVTQTNLLQVLDPLEIVSIIQTLQTKVEEQTVQLRQTNQQLAQEVKQRRQVEESLRQAQQDLELRVKERTAELLLTNVRLQKEIEERKQAQALLQQREYEWQALFNHALDAIAIADDEGRYINVNPAACDLFGLSKEELLGSTIGDFAEPGFDFTQAWQQFCEQGQMLGEFKLHRWDGTVRETEFAAVANFLPHCHLSILRDVSTRKQAEEAQRESEERLQLALLAGNAGTWDWNIPTDKVIWSESVFALFGLDKDTFSGKFESFFNCVHPEDRELVVNTVQQAVDTQMSQYRVEYRLVKPDGTICWAEAIGRVFYNETAQPLDMRGIVIDITVRKQAEAALRTSQQQLQAIIDNSPAVIYVKDVKGRHILVNSEFERITHLTREQVNNKTDYELFSPDIAQALSRNDQNVLTSLTPLQSEEVVKLDDRQHTYITVKFPLYNADEQPYGICGISTDITEKKQLEQQFYRAQRLESIGTLASGIAHDLNNVFAPIVMISQLLPSRCTNVDARTQELFKTIENSCQRGADLVKQILTFARGNEGKKILLQPGHLLKELVKVIKQTFLQSIEIVANIPTNTLWMVQADPTQLEQVFMNLAVNARDAMPNGGTLTITAENRIIDSTYARMHHEAEAGDYIVVTMEDTGTGISPEIEERIFDPFFTTKEVGKGTGLGLSTVLGIVKNYGGFVEVASQVGKGTQFQVFLPRGEGTASEVTTEGKLPTGKGELILVVDDEEIVHQTIQETLADYNYKTLVAKDGIEALALYVGYGPEISAVLLDILMPNMDGLTAIRTLRTINPNVKIIASSGLPANEQKAFAAGADQFLSKPYTTTDLLTTLSDVIGVKE